MSKIDFITELYDSVPEDKKDAFIANVAQSAAQYRQDWDLSPDQMAELKRRLADPNPRYVSAEFLSKKYGVDFPG